MQYFLRRHGDQGSIDLLESESFGLLCKDGIEFGTTNYNAYPTTENLDRCFLWMERGKGTKTAPWPPKLCKQKSLPDCPIPCSSKMPRLPGN